MRCFSLKMSKLRGYTCFTTTLPQKSDYLPPPVPVSQNGLTGYGHLKKYLSPLTMCPQVYILQMVHKFCHTRCANIFRLVLRHSPVRTIFWGKMTVKRVIFHKNQQNWGSKFHFQVKIGTKYIKCINIFQKVRTFGKHSRKHLNFSSLVCH